MSSHISCNKTFRAEHVGSFLRPDDLLHVRHAWNDKKATGIELKTAEDNAVNQIVKLQQDLGFHGINDGEYRRHMFWGTFWSNLDGMKEIVGPDPGIFRPYIPDVARVFGGMPICLSVAVDKRLEAIFIQPLDLSRILEEITADRFQKNHKPGEAVICTSKIGYNPAASKAHIEQLQYLQKILPKENHDDIKLTIPAPNWYHLRYKDGQAYPKDVYKTDDEYFADVITVFQKELQVLYDHGLRNVQIDDPNICYFCNSKMVVDFDNDPLNTIKADALFDKYIDVYNKIMEKAPKGLSVGVHLCRGNFVKSRHFTEGSYDRIAVRLLQNLKVPILYLEFDTERAGTFEPLQHVPADKHLILGVVSSKYPKLEDFDDTVARVYEAARYIANGTGRTKKEALDQLSVSPQCGFASHSSGNAVTWDDMVAKLKLVKQVTEKIWPGEA